MIGLCVVVDVVVGGFVCVDACVCVFVCVGSVRDPQFSNGVTGKILGVTDLYRIWNILLSESR